MHPEYVAARRALLDTLEALGSHRKALILVGAQAIYFWTGAADLAVAEYTTDADIAIDPRVLQPEPDLAIAMRDAGFYLDEADGASSVGIWSSRQTIDGKAAVVKVDLLVPQALGGAWRRAARLGPDHQRGAALKVHGLEAAVVDKTTATIVSLDEADKRSFDMAVAGPAALLVSKVHKLNQRVGESDQGRSRRLKDKDALDILRLLRATDLQAMAQRLRVLREDPLAGVVTREALEYLPGLFGTADRPGSLMAARAAFPEPEAVIAMSCVALAAELMEAVGA